MQKLEQGLGVTHSPAPVSPWASYHHGLYQFEFKLEMLLASVLLCTLQILICAKETWEINNEKEQTMPFSEAKPHSL